MAVNVTVFDLENFPNNSKTVTVDMSELVPLGNSGEDVWVLSATTTATASGGSAIQKLYINNTKWGWAKSSSLNAGPYDVTGSQRHLKFAIDEAIGSAVEIALDSNALPLSGEAVAKDMQAKLNATAGSGGAKDGNLAYLNAVVQYSGNTFRIISGTASDLYTGTDRSSVDVADGATTTGLAVELGFDILITSEQLSSTQIKQTSLASGYTSGVSLTVTNGGLISPGDCLGITDGTSTEFRGVESAIGAGVTLSSGMDNTYAAGSLVQVLTLQDSTGEPPPAYATVDDYIKFSISSIVNQIDFS